MNTCRKDRKANVFSCFGQQYSVVLFSDTVTQMSMLYKVHILQSYIFPYLVQQVNWEAIQVIGRKVIVSNLTIAYQTILVI